MRTFFKFSTLTTPPHLPLLLHLQTPYTSHSLCDLSLPLCLLKTPYTSYHPSTSHSHSTTPGPFTLLQVPTTSHCISISHCPTPLTISHLFVPLYLAIPPLRPSISLRSSAPLPLYTSQHLSPPPTTPALPPSLLPSIPRCLSTPLTASPYPSSP